MEVVSTIDALRARLEGERKIAFVPTMGNLHEGHLTLMKLARQHAPCVVASIFVNRLQFGPTEDFAQYPRTLEEDCAKLKSCKVDIAFTPDENVLYPVPQRVMVDLPPVANELCGKFRPGHFRGVATVVLKLFNIVQPQTAVFGKKDYQQLFIIRELVRELNLPIEIISAETARDANGLALSSRNSYLSAAERLEAARLYQTLVYIKEQIESGERDFGELQEKAEKKLDSHGWRVDYVAVRKSLTMEPAQATDKALVVLGAAWLGKIRLIDNLEVFITK
ncbi:MAG TPA: pantoate--beta-alanine ligase [Burkholderiales bacterium]|nr:pantoate--beta-alanine ligase [Burkholderiales bacterium]